MNKSLSSLLLFAALSFAQAAETPTIGFVRQPNPIPLDANGSELTFPKATDGHLSFSLTWRQGKSRETVTMTEKGFFRHDGWFVYVESATRVWLFDGARQLDVVTSDGRYSVAAKGVFEACPKAVWDALPESAQKFFRANRNAS